jgi:hypothetical protein
MEGASESAVHLEGDFHFKAEDLLVRNTPRAFELHDGATVDLEHTYYNPE